MLGAPDLFHLAGLAERAAAEQASGRRVIALGTTTARFPDDGEPPPIVPLGVVVLAEELRPETRETVAFLAAEGVELKVLSGDAPETVGRLRRTPASTATGRRSTAASCRPTRASWPPSPATRR